MMAALSALLCLLSPITFAHKVILDAYVIDNSIEGEVGFSNGMVAALTPVYVLDKDDNIIDTVTTDADGLFIYPPRFFVDHHLYVNLGAGHIDNALIAIADLADLSDIEQLLDYQVWQNNPLDKGRLSADNVSSDRAGWVEPTTASTGSSHIKSDALAASPANQAAIVAEKNTFQQILGGLGYIFGLVGLGYFMMAKQAIRQQRPNPVVVDQSGNSHD